MKNEWKMSHFHNRAQRACCRGKSKNFCQFMEIKDPKLRQACLAGSAWLVGAASFLCQHVPWEAFGGCALERVWALTVGNCKGYPWGHCSSPSVCATSTRQSYGLGWLDNVLLQVQELVLVSILSRFCIWHTVFCRSALLMYTEL